MSNKIIQELLRYCKILESESLVAEGDCISIRDGDGMLATDPSKRPLEQTEESIAKYGFAQVPATQMLALHREIYLVRADVSAVITNHAPYCSAVATKIKKLPAVLDDVAQIIGPSVKVAPSYAAVDIIKILGKRDACLVKGGGAVSVGRTPDEAYTGSLVLEKGAKAYVEGTILGGAKKIPYAEALLMRFVYKQKYSKADQTAKKEELYQ